VALYLHAWGDPQAPPVVCLHGILAHGRRFRKLAEERLAARFRVLAPDLRGHGRSEWMPPWTISAQLDDLLETLDHAGVSRAAFLGHSYGARLTMELAFRAPERVERAVLLDPAIWVPPPVALERAELERADKSFRSPAEAIEHRLASGTVFSTPRELLEEEAAEHLERGDDGRYRWRYSQSAVVATWGEMTAPPPPFDELRMPTLIVRGERTDVLPDVLVDLVRAEWGGPLEIVEVPGGHVVLWDAFDQTADAVAEFLH
jgi:lipase